MNTFRRLCLIVARFFIGQAMWFVPALAAGDDLGQPSATEPANIRTGKVTAFVLLSDGRLIKGTLSEEDSMVIVTQPIGSMRFPKKRIEKLFNSMQEVYRYKLEQLPENDFDERMKLARWCLEHQMDAEAKEQLQAILTLDPKHPHAKAMLTSLDAQARPSTNKRDPDVKQISIEQSRSIPEEHPGSLDASIINGARMGMGISGIPVVFDLPPSLAVKRTEEFARYVHPVLQTYCARCHNDRYEGKFQLIQMKTKQDRTLDTMRVNLDATLKLIDRQNPSRSELLASSLRPHGHGPNTRPIFQGSNNTAYQILAKWVNNLRVGKTSDGVTPARLAGPGLVTGEAFASDRNRISREPQAASGLSPEATGGGPSLEATVLPPMRFQPGKGLQPDDAADPNEFPIPFAISGAKPKEGATGQPAKTSDGKTLSPEAPRTRDGQGATNATTASTSGKDPADGETTKKSPRKPLKLDPGILQRALQLRNQGRSE